MTLMDMMNEMNRLGGQIRAKAQEVATAGMQEGVKFAEIEAKQAEMKELQNRYNALQSAYEIEKNAQAGQLKDIGGAAPAEKKSRKDILASREYARAFAYAIRNGLNPRNGAQDEKIRILYDAMTEGGGNPAGTDGGFLVPIDIDNSIRELKRDLNPLAPLFTQETVTAPTGWRVIDTAPTAAMPSIVEMGTITSPDQPAFAKVSYTLTKYGLRIPISNELLSDEAAGLMPYLSRWFAKKLVLTENSLLLTALKTLAASAMTTGTITADDAIKTILNKTLDPAISASAVILTNQSGFDALDQLKDDTGRGMLQPDPTNATLMRMFSRRVVTVSDAQLPNTSDKPEFFIGDFREFATLFSKDGFEVTSTDIGGSAWETDSVEVRGITRMCVTKFDEGAAVRRQLTLA